MYDPNMSVDQMNYGNIDTILSGISMSDALNLWQKLLDARMALPPNDRFFELKGMLEDHTVPVYQAYQGIDVVVLRAQYFASSGPDTGWNPLSLAVLALVEAIRGPSAAPVVAVPVVSTPPKRTRR